MGSIPEVCISPTPKIQPEVFVDSDELDAPMPSITVKVASVPPQEEHDSNTKIEDISIVTTADSIKESISSKLTTHDDNDAPTEQKSEEEVPMVHADMTQK